MTDYMKDITKVVTDLGLEDISSLLKEALDKGEDPSALLQAMSQGMVKVGKIFETGEYFLADLVIAGEIMKEGLKVIEPHFNVESFGNKGTVVLCTVKGDIHDIGKNLVANMLTSCGFRVVDLGVDVHEDRIVEAVRKEGADALGLSVLLTPMVRSISDVVSALSAAGLREKIKIAIGGACTTQALAQSSGVDAVGKDPVEAVKIFETFMNK
jgi:methylmalonyl-CoA mutase cobalamin-binding domain/chain